MRAFVVGTLAAVLVALATGVALNLVEVESARFNSTEHVRL